MLAHADAHGKELEGFKDNLVSEQENAAAAWALQELQAERAPGACIHNTVGHCNKVAAVVDAWHKHAKMPGLNMPRWQ